MHIRLDPLGGVAGDMFVAAVIAAFPEHAPAVSAAIAALGLGPRSECRIVDHHDGVLAGKRFVVAAETAGPHDAHPHRTWASIRDLILGAPLDDATRRHAVAIFALLADAEAEVHGMAPAEVAFHEVGAIDSICDIVAAAQLIGSLGAGGSATWSVGPLPLGSGYVPSAHGRLPVPAPATALLLRGLATIDDGIAGERVTPTGAAIVRHLAGAAAPAAAVRVLERTGIGFGTRKLPGISNCLRVLVFDDFAAKRDGSTHRELAVLQFEVDDQSPEDLALGLDRLRALPGVHDVIQAPVIGKKGRMVAHVQVLAAPAILAQAIEACFEETTTIGLRYHVVSGVALARSTHEVHLTDRVVRVKAVERPKGGHTAKAELGDVAEVSGSAPRVRLRRSAEDLALGRQPAAPRGKTEKPEPGDIDVTALHDAIDRMPPGETLAQIIRAMPSVAVAVSGGIDSLTLATIAQAELGERSLMLHAASPAVPAQATARVRELARAQGWRLDVVDAGEFGHADYLRNPVDRCFFCKTSLYATIARRTDAQIVSGANLDDLGEYRPGLTAAREHAVRHPYIEAGIDKATVRALARERGLGDLAELPASPCLSSRVETGIAIRADVLRSIHAVESFVARTMRVRTVRCRVRASGIVVELDAASLATIDARARASIQCEAARAFAGVVDTGELAFAAYRNGSAFVGAPGAAE